MPMVRLSFSPAPAHVRTARLVGVAVARKAGVAEEFLEEIRLAIGEACSRAVALHQSGGVSKLIDVTMTDSDRFMVQVVDHAAEAATGRGRAEAASLIVDEGTSLMAPASDGLAEEAVVARMGLALLAGVVEDLEVSVAPGGAGTRVRMSWPLWRYKIHDMVE